MPTRRKILSTAFAASILACVFYMGVYVGSAHGIFYSLGLMAYKAAVPPIYHMETAEENLRELRRSDELELTGLLAEYGQYLDESSILLRVYNPWGLNSTGRSFFNSAVKLRLENPPQKAPFPEIPEEITLEYLEAQLDPDYDNGSPESLEGLRKYLETTREQNRYYDKVIMEHSK